jgi:hypothetical protein
MRPWAARDFEWDEVNQAKLWDHRIRPWEVDEVFWDWPKWANNKKGRRGDYLMVGRTDAGRWLTVPVQVKAATRQLRPITGWDSSQAELSKYGRGRR